MKYLLMFIDSEDAEHAESDPETYARIGAWFEEWNQKGKILGAEELRPVSTATTVRFDSGKPVVTDGPFLEAKESIGGYAVIDAADLDEAIAMARTWPGLGPVEIRPTVQMAEAPRN